MKCTKKTPKTFVISVQGRRGRPGYVRYVYGAGDADASGYGVRVVGRIGDASKFVNLEKVKPRAAEIKSRYGFETVEIVDEMTGKRHLIQ